MKDNAKPKAKAGNKKKIINIIVDILLVIVFLFGVLCSYTAYVSKSGSGVPDIFGVRLFSIQTESMEPTFSPGDLIVDVAVKDPSKLEKDDVITFWFVKDGEMELNTHRIVDIEDKGNYLSFTTKGDAYDQNDIGKVHQGDIEGKYLFAIPLMGYVIEFLKSSLGFLLIIVLPVFAFFVYNLIRFFRVFMDFRMQKMRAQLQQEMMAEKAAAAPAPEPDLKEIPEPEPEPEPEQQTQEHE